MSPDAGSGLGAARVRDSLLGLDQGAATMDLRFRTAVVTVVSKTSAPWTVVVRFNDGVTSPAMACVGWYDPTVNDVVQVVQSGTSLMCWGGFAGVAKVVTTTATVVTPPAPAVPAAPPAAAPTIRTAYISADSTAAWSAIFGPGWRTDNDDVYQTGTSAQRGFWFYGSKISAAKGSGTITGGTIYIARRDSSHGVGGQANVLLGTHGNGTRPGSGATAHNGVSQVGTLGRGQDGTFKLTDTQVAALNGGAAGLGLEPGVVGTSSADYLIALGIASSGASGQLALTISG